MPPAITGCRVFTRPSSISGKPVASATSFSGAMPASFSNRNVPPVERISTPHAGQASREIDDAGLVCYAQQGAPDERRRIFRHGSNYCPTLGFRANGKKLCAGPEKRARIRLWVRRPSAGLIWTRWLAVVALAATVWSVGMVTARADEDLGEGALLVADRRLKDPNFEKSVVLIVAYDEQGAVGLVLNRQSDVPVSQLLAGVKDARDRKDTAFSGGPVEPKSVLALLRAHTGPDGAQQISGISGPFSTRICLKTPGHTSPAPTSSGSSWVMQAGARPVGSGTGGRCVARDPGQRRTPCLIRRRNLYGIAWCATWT